MFGQLPSTVKRSANGLECVVAAMLVATMDAATCGPARGRFCPVLGFGLDCSDDGRDDVFLCRAVGCDG